ncbi:hypothetical protein F0L17_12370 [Streptomyces sp. TRM43335]|uniref:Uncharacterized protein n=1 Tax=Streptomyces taklimakanensis TaxID=2569853 RepID=A0A6G2BCP1_9ACTN|nr:hypothetical protein [Streptomyces taklimakanensis]MTE19896.1 hypothetical protein [Streptomyces taklimakanensis]
MWGVRSRSRRRPAVVPPALARLALGVLGVLGVLVLSGCGGRGSEGITEIREAFEDGDGGSVVGEERTIEGRVADVVSPWAFTVGGDEPGGVEPMLVVEGDMPPVDQDDVVRVTGTVREFDLQEVQEELGVNLSDGLYRDYQGEPYIRARSITEDVGTG